MLRSLALLVGLAAAVPFDSSYRPLPFSQAWTDTGLITTTDDWSGVSGIQGFLGQDLTTSTGTDPQTIVTGASAVAGDLDVMANRTTTTGTGGVAEFQSTPQGAPDNANPTIALQGSATADAPHLILYLNTTGMEDVTVAYNLRDIECNTDNAVQPVALQYRVGNSGDFTNVPAGFVADATTGPSLCTLVTPVSAQLPAAADGQAQVQVRIITADAAGSDEWVGIDDLSVTGTAVPVTVTATSNTFAGWRLVAPPVGGLTVGTLAGLNLVQGLSDEFPGFGPNLFTGYTGYESGAYAGFTLPAAKTDALTPGKGVLWYFFTSGGPGPDDARGTSRRAALPLTLTATGMAQTGDVAAPFTAADRTNAENEFYLLGNPFAMSFDLTGLTTSSGTLKDVFQFYLPGTGWVTRTREDPDGGTPADDDVSVWQGFFGEFQVAPTLPVTFTYDADARVDTAPAFLGKTAQAAERRRLGLVLTGTAGTGAAVRDEAAGLYFAPRATDGWDVLDASKRAPLTSVYATIAPVGPAGDGTPKPLAQLSLPYALEAPVTVPLAFSASHAGRYALAWPVLDDVPPTWRLQLTDRVTGAVTDLRAAAAYAFESDRATDSPRFDLTVGPAGATGAGTETPPAGYTLTAMGPNPATRGARAVLRVAERQRVQAEVFDVLGRRVARLFDGIVAARTPQVLEVVAGQLSPGTYVLRVRGERFAESRPLTVVR